MRILLGKRANGKTKVTLVPGRGAGKAPVVLKGLTRETLRGAVGSAYKDILGRESSE